MEVGAAVDDLAAGDVVVPAGTTCFDAVGLPARTWGFDDPRRGCYATEVVLPRAMLCPAPLDCGLNLWQIAVLPLRAGNAYHLWRRGHGMFRVKVSQDRLAFINVLTFGGGVSELLAMLAKAEGHDAFYCAGNRRRREYLEGFGITTIDQLRFNRFAAAGDVRLFAGFVRKLTASAGMHVVCDMFRGQVFKAGLAVMARGGVNVSAGWQLASEVAYNSALVSLKQITLDHAHVAAEGTEDAVTSLFGRVFRPAVHPTIYTFEELPLAIQDLKDGRHDGFAAIQVQDSLPESLQALSTRPALGPRDVIPRPELARATPPREDGPAVCREAP